jgi:mRNA interferase RelE/StbE
VASYEIFIKPSAVKELEGLPSKAARRIVAKIRALGADPRPPGCEKLSGSERYRIRQGDHRVLYEIEDSVRQATVVKVGHRREVHR